MESKRRRNPDLPPDLPPELVVDVLAKLPVKAVLRFRTVCSAWRDVIESPMFVKMHLSNAKNRPEKVLLQDYSSNRATFYVDGRRVESPMYGSKFHVYHSHGVLLVVGVGSMRLWNPSTGRSREIADSPTCSCSDCFHGFPTGFSYGLCYDPASDGFTVLILRCITGYDVVNIFDSRSDTWKTVHIPTNLNLNLNRRSFSTSYKSNAFVHGCFHFIVSGRIWRFSPEGKTVTDFQPPPQISATLDNFATDVFRGRLCLKGTKCFCNLEVWEMETYGDAGSWRQIFKVPLQPPPSSSPLSPLNLDVKPFPIRISYIECFTPLYLLENGHRILVRNNKTDLYLQDLDTDTMTKIPSLPSFRNWFTIAIEPYTESLLSP